MCLIIVIIAKYHTKGFTTLSIMVGIRGERILRWKPLQVNPYILEYKKSQKNKKQIQLYCHALIRIS